MLTGRLTRWRGPGDDAGFTLIELIISIAVLGVLVTAVAAAMFTALGTDKTTDARLSESRDLQTAASYLADDVAGAQSFAVSGTAECGSDPLLLELRGQQFNNSSLATSEVVITYVLRSATVDGAASRVLHRLTCEGATSASLAQTGDVTVARLISTTVNPTVACKNAAGGTVSCGDASAATVSVDVTSRSGDLTARLTGHRRTS